jgi:hypothetical protein
MVEASLAYSCFVLHTPGPWVFYNAGIVNQGGAKVYSLASLKDNSASVHDGVWLADIRMGSDPKYKTVSPQEGAANAKLIAAAPDLLAVCLNILEHHGGGKYFGPLCAAIVKAGARIPGIVDQECYDEWKLEKERNGRHAPAMASAGLKHIPPPSGSTE